MKYNNHLDVFYSQSNLSPSKIIIRSVDGKQVIHGDNFFVASNASQVRLPIDQLPMGVYTVQVFFGKNNMGVGKFMKN